MARTSRTGGNPSVAVIGAGFGGLGMAVRLRQAGYDQLALFERWDYPGVDPGELLTSIRFGCEVRAAGLLPDGRWRLVLADGRVHHADLLVCATGHATRPALAAAGAGRPRRVAVVGTGAHADGYVPHLVPDVGHLAVYAGPPLTGLRLPDPSGPPQAGPGRLVLTAARREPLDRRRVTVVADRLAGIGPRGPVAADGTVRPADVVVFTTGFTAAEFLAPLGPARAGPRPVRPDEPAAYLGVTVAGLPNLFLVYGPHRRRSRVRPGDGLPAHRIVRGTRAGFAGPATGLGPEPRG